MCNKQILRPENYSNKIYVFSLAQNMPISAQNWTLWGWNARKSTFQTHSIKSHTFYHTFVLTKNEVYTLNNGLQ